MERHKWVEITPTTGRWFFSYGIALNKENKSGWVVIQQGPNSKKTEFESLDGLKGILKENKLPWLGVNRGQ